LCGHSGGFGVLDAWPCDVWPGEAACGRPAVLRLVRLNANLPDLAVCERCLFEFDQLRLDLRAPAA
jgi:hypothetical protein